MRANILMMIDDANWRDAVASLFREMRKARGLSQKELGSFVEMPQSAIARLENSWHHVSTKSLSRIAAVTDHSLRIYAVPNLPEGITIDLTSSTYETEWNPQISEQSNTKEV